MNKRSLSAMALAMVAILFALNLRSTQVSAATLCVDPGGGGGCFTTIQAAINAAMPGDTINVAPGTYTENLILNKSLTLNGARMGVDARGRITGPPNPAVESVITAASGTVLQLQTGSAGSVINGFAFSGGTRGIESASGPLNNLQILDNFIGGFTNAGVFLNDTGLDITVDQNEIDGTSKTGGGGLFHLDTDNFDGFRFTNNTIQNGATATGFFVDGNHNVGVSANRSPLITGNHISGQTTGMNLGRFAFEFGEISLNTFTSNVFDGLQGGIQNTTIKGNNFTNNGRSGLALTGFGGAGDATRGAQNSMIICNTFTGNGFTQNGEALLFSSGQFPGTISTNQANDNNISGNNRGATYGGTETIDAEDNWWGSANGPTHINNPGGTGDVILNVSGSLDFSPFRTAVIPDSNGDGLLNPCETACVSDTEPPTITCPTSFTTTTGQPGATSAVVNFTEPSVAGGTASDNCFVQSVVCTPPSGSAFPVGTTTVTCTASDPTGNTATCSFTVTVFDVCLQDDSNRGNVLTFNSSTGDYVFCCGGQTFTGKGVVNRAGNTFTLTHNAGNRRVQASLSTGTKKGAASLQSPPGRTLCSITDRNINDNTCSCSP